MPYLYATLNVLHAIEVFMSYWPVKVASENFIKFLMNSLLYSGISTNEIN